MDDFNSIRDTEQTCLLEPMEQQSISVSKVCLLRVLEN